jgi:hypothetical protein
MRVSEVRRVLAYTSLVVLVAACGGEASGAGRGDAGSASVGGRANVGGANTGGTANLGGAVNPDRVLSPGGTCGGEPIPITPAERAALEGEFCAGQLVDISLAGCEDIEGFAVPPPTSPQTRIEVLVARQGNTVRLPRACSRNECTQGYQVLSDLSVRLCSETCASLWPNRPELDTVVEVLYGCWP